MLNKKYLALEFLSKDFKSQMGFTPRIHYGPGYRIEMTPPTVCPVTGPIRTEV